MSEFLIASAYVLVPLFIAVPLLTKYIDMRHAAIQAARYEAWEYTVWYNPADDNNILDNFSAVTVPEKSPTQTQKEARRRFFSDISEEGTLPITSADKNDDWKLADANGFWNDTTHGVPLYSSGKYDDSASLTSSTDTPTLPILGDVINTLMDIVGFAFDALGSVLGFIGSSAGFTAINTDGYSTATVAFPVRTLDYFNEDHFTVGDDIGGDTTNKVFSARASVLGDGWNAGGREHASNQVQGTIPTILFKALIDPATAPGQVLGPVWDVVSILAPELARCFDANNRPFEPLNSMLNAMDRPNGSLWWAHVDFDSVHPDRLATGGTHVCDDAGVCQFENSTPVEDLVCIP